nr:hypothetical transcript [Hymenolepis microstoma]
MRIVYPGCVRSLHRLANRAGSNGVHLYLSQFIQPACPIDYLLVYLLSFFVRVPKEESSRTPYRSVIRTFYLIFYLIFCNRI